MPLSSAGGRTRSCSTWRVRSQPQAPWGCPKGTQFGVREPNRPSCSPFGPAVRVTIIAPNADTKCPQAIDGNRISLGITHIVDERARIRIVRIDMTVSEISDQQGTGECPEIGRRQCDAPGRIELAVLNEAHKRVTTEIEGVDDSVALTGHIVMLCPILNGKGHDQPAPYRDDVEWGIGRIIAAGDARVCINQSINIPTFFS
jgi:hypothetical protein